MNPLTAYPEGGLSRDGRLRPPRMGLIDYMVRSFDPAGERDVVFIPVGINYDRTLEDRSLLASLQTDAKPRNATFALRTTARFMLRNLAQMAGRRWYRFGYACVNFGRPISLKRYLAEHDFDFRGLDRENRFARVEALTATLMAAVRLTNGGSGDRLVGKLGEDLVDRPAQALLDDA